MSRYSVRRLCVMAMLCAMVTVLRLPGIALQLPTLKITFGFLPVALTAMLYGPFAAVAVGMLGDFLSCMLAGSGWIWLLTMVEGVTALVYGLFLSPEQIAPCEAKQGARLAILPRVLIAQAIISILCHIVLNTLSLKVWGYFANQTVAAAMWTRVIKNVVLYPIEVLLLLAISRLPAVLRRARVI